MITTFFSFLAILFICMDCPFIQANDISQPNPPWIYEEDGVEYVNISMRNETVRFVLQQQFFNNIQENFINQIFDLLERFSLNMEEMELEIDELMVVDFNLTNLRVKNLQIDNSKQLMLLGNDSIKMQIQDFTGQFHADYRYVSEPQLFDDQGQFDLYIYNSSLTSNFSALIDEDEMLAVDLKTLDLDIKPFIFSILGYSDSSILAARTFTYLGNIFRDRMISLTKFVGAQRFNELFNRAIELIPDEIDIPLTDLYTQGGISKDFSVKENDYVSFSMDISLQNRVHALDKKNLVEFKDTESHREFEIQLFLSEYFIQSLVHASYYGGLLRLPITEMTALESKLLWIRYSYALTHHQFSQDFPCAVSIEAVDMVPQFHISQSNGLKFEAILKIDFLCQKESEPGRFQNVFSIKSTPIQFTGNILINKDFVVKVDNLNFDFNADQIIDSHIGRVSTWEIKTVLSLFNNFIVATIQFFFRQGFPMGWVLELVQLDFLDLEDSLMKAYDNYYIFFFTPKFNIEKLNDQVMNTLKFLLELYLGKDNYTLKIIDKESKETKSNRPFQQFEYSYWPTSSNQLIESQQCKLHQANILRQSEQMII